MPVRGGTHTNYNRLVFDFVQTPAYTLKQEGTRVTLTFSAKADLTLTKSVTNLMRIAGVESRDDADKTVVTFAVPEKASVKHFISGTGIVVDVKGNGKAIAVPMPAAAEQTAAPVTPLLPAAAVPEMSTAAVPAEMAAVPEEAAPTPTTPAAQAPTPVPEIPVPAMAVKNRPPLFAAPANTDLPKMVVGLVPTLLATINPRDTMPAAIYQRGDYVYTAFDRRLSLDLKNLFQTESTVTPDTISTGSFSAYSLPMPANAEAQLSKNENTWQIDVLKKGSAARSLVARDLLPRTDPLYSLGARVVIPLIGGASILSFIDPVAGDVLYLVPTANIEDRVLVTRRFADFELLPTLQGIVIRVLNDGLSVRMIEEGVEITAPRGLNLSAGDVDVETRIARTGVRPKRDGEELIPLTLWQQNSLGDFNMARQALQLRITDATDDNVRARARLDLVRFYLGHGMGSEALGLMEMIIDANLDITSRPEFQLLQALGFILANRPDEGLAALEAAGFSDRDEVRLWTAVGLAEQRKFDEAARDFSATLLLLENYPSPFAERFAALAAETFIAVADDVSGARMIDLMINRQPTGVLREATVQYLRGIMQARAGNLFEARKLWQQASQSEDYLARVRAELALVDLEVSTKNMKVEAAAKKLEGLRFAWRGDELELEMLNRLADYQLKANAPTDAMDTLEHAKSIYPNSVRDEEITSQQRAIFRKIFIDNIADNKASPLQMLSLYERYKDFSPIDPTERLVIMNDVVDKMVAIDLLPQAIGVLNPELNGNANAGQKTKMALRLAALNLLNGEPDKAEVALKAIDTATLSSDEQQEAKLLQARALSDQDRNDAAIQLLTGDGSPAAQRLISTAAWRAKQWVRSAEALAGIMPPLGTSISADGAQLILARAVALSLAGDGDSLTKLYADYGAAMKDKPQGQAFAILANKDVVAGAATLARVQEQAKDVDLFQGFLDNYKKAGAPSPPPEEPKKNG